MERKPSSLAGPLWVIGIGLCILGAGLFFVASVLSHKRKDEERERVTIAAARLKVTSETDTTTVTTTTFPTSPVRPNLPVGSNSTLPTPPAAVQAKPPTESSPITPPITAPKKAGFFGLAGNQTTSGLAETPQIFGRVILKGTPPPEKELPLDPGCGKLHPTRKPTTRFYSVAADGGLADVFIEIRGVTSSGYQIPTEPIVIDQVGCEYVPYVTAALARQTILVKNSDPMLHNVHPTPTVSGNRESNRAHLPKAAPLQFSFDQPELFLRFKCDVHPWMFAYVSVVSHPYFAVTDATGAFRLNASPPPGRYTIEAHHRKASKFSVPIEVRPGGILEVDFEMQVPAGNQ